MKYKIIGGVSLPNIPWEDKPEDCNEVLWRSKNNPVIPRNLIPCANSIFNSAVVAFQDGFAGVFRIDDKRREMRIHSGISKDGLAWEINNDPIEFITADGRKKKIFGYDPRVCFMEGKYYVSFCNCEDGPTVGLAYTTDFKDFYEIGNAFLPFNRNGVLFPRKINKKYAMLSRPSDNGHTPFGNIFYSESPDLEHWGHHHEVMRTTRGWQALKIGAGPVPIETEEGWLLIYHGVLLSCNGYVYSAGVAILDTDKPWIVKYRASEYIISPQIEYECIGDVQNVVFPCAALCDADTGRIALYYGGADTVTCIAYTTVDDLVQFTKDHTEK